MQEQSCIKAACDMLLQYGKPDAKAKLKKCIRKYILRQSVAPQDLIFWPTGFLAAGLWQCFVSLRNNETAKSGKTGSLSVNSTPVKDIETALDAYFDRWRRKGFPVACMDDLLAGEVFLDMYLTNIAEEEETTQKSSLLFTAEKINAYKEAVNRLAAYALSHPTDRNGCFPYRSNWQEKYIYVDSIGLACPFLYKYGVSFEKPKYTELALRQIEYFLACGMDDETGLPYHGYEAESGVKYGVIGWGRAAGWLLRGMQGCMIDEYGRERLGSAFCTLTEKVLSYQRKDGLFSWQMQAVEGPGDTSATGMICAALQEGIKIGLLKEEKYRQALVHGSEAICQATEDGLVYQCSGECEGFGRYPQIYGAYPWSLGPALLLDIEPV